MGKRIMLDKHRGCLLGGAIGDALGYTVKTEAYEEIEEKYGNEGIRLCELSKNKARISCNTQLTLFTADGLLQAEARRIHSKSDYRESMLKAYKNWCRTQPESNGPKYTIDENLSEVYSSWLLRIPELYSERYIKEASLKEIKACCRENLTNHVNSSKDCGGLTRVAPIGLYFCSPSLAAEIAAENAVLTNGHPLGYIPAASLAYFISLCCAKPEMKLRELIINTLREMDCIYQGNKYLDCFLEIMVKAVLLSKENKLDEECIREIGKGWSAEETLAIAVFCALRHENNFEDAIFAAVNHNGNRAATGSVLGTILGVYLGYKAIPKRFVQKLELKKQLMIFAEDLLNSEPYPKDEEAMKIWKSKYLEYSFIA